MPFRVEIENVARQRKSNLILALDFSHKNRENRAGLLSEAQGLLDAVQPYICAVKFNHHLVLPLGALDGVQKLVERAHDHGLQTIMDCKINDIGSTNQVIAEYYYEAGFDAVIANPFIGWDEGLKPVFDVAQRLDRGVILLTYMSHKAAPEGYGQTIIDQRTSETIPQYISFARKALNYKADGAVVGATYPGIIREIKEVLGESVPIYSPGIGAQGGDIRAALNAGSRYLIVGRAITQSQDPGEVARSIQALASK